MLYELTPFPTRCPCSSVPPLLAHLHGKPAAGTDLAGKQSWQAQEVGKPAHCGEIPGTTARGTCVCSDFGAQSAACSCEIAKLWLLTLCFNSIITTDPRLFLDLLPLLLIAELNYPSSCTASKPAQSKNRCALGVSVFQTDYMLEPCSPALHPTSPQSHRADVAGAAAGAGGLSASLHNRASASSKLKTKGKQGDKWRRKMTSLVSLSAGHWFNW